MFDAARNGDADVLLQAVDVGLPANLTNDAGAKYLLRGESLPVAHYS